jgi:hypothetical protein
MERGIVNLVCRSHTQNRLASCHDRPPATLVVLESGSAVDIFFRGAAQM